MQRLKGVLSKVLRISPSEITDETSPRTIETWDSFQALTLISELEVAFNVHFSMEDVLSVQNVGDIKACLKKHGIALEE